LFFKNVLNMDTGTGYVFVLTSRSTWKDTSLFTYSGYGSK